MMIILIYDLSVYDATFYDGNHIRMAFFLSFFFFFFLIKKKYVCLSSESLGNM
jgi:hypothetical protein